MPAAGRIAQNSYFEQLEDLSCEDDVFGVMRTNLRNRHAIIPLTWSRLKPRGYLQTCPGELHSDLCLTPNGGW